MFMTDQEPFPLVLLGAGASAPAGVPTAVEMTRRMMEACRQDAQHDYLRALSAIYGGLQMGLGQSEVPRLGCPDVEQVLNAASLLGDRFNLEFAPFVATWHPIIGELERRNFSRLDAQAVVSSAMSRLSSIGRRGTAMSETEALSAFGAVLQEALSKMGDHLSQYPDGALFRRLNAYLTGKLIEFTWLQSPEKLVYLDPLLAAARHVPIAVATLNYDNAVELRGAHLGVPCETGLSAWSATGQLPLVATGIDLMKLHGSVRWRWSTRSAKSAIG